MPVWPWRNDFMEDTTDKSVLDLIEHYEKEIVFRFKIKGRHLDSRIEQSKAIPELVARSWPVPAMIARHLQDIRFSEDGELAYAWKQALGRIGSAHHLPGIPP